MLKRFPGFNKRSRIAAKAMLVKISVSLFKICPTRITIAIITARRTDGSNPVIKVNNKRIPMIIML